ncbi:MAG: hypothetical protein BGO97_14775 [Micrococcales bacterium 70-64]|nr:PmoA family protein [Leifsonia sp.]ODU65174.1 MAG: hypothetical protein ABT06_14775 [Leifsonia sp. SCN 70-46]OJX86866.1 MAG: hypothetical protein BGO97_14775 [Micrococcales bacterium 70-64]
MADATITRTGDTLTVSVGSTVVAEYHATSDVERVNTPKPFLHPLRTLGGTVVTGFAPDDHPWHHGLQFAFPRVGDHNLWGGGTYLSPDEGYRVLDDQGSIRHDTWGVVADDDGTARFEHELTWLGNGGEVLLTEHRAFALSVRHGLGWTLDTTSTLTNATTGPLALATPAQRGRPDGGYGGLFLRLGEDVQADRLIGAHGDIASSGSESRTLVVQAHDAAGQPLTLGLSFVEGATPGARKWLYRFAPEPFSAIGWAGAYDDGFELAPGESLTFGHRLAVMDGVVPAEAVEALL